LQLLLVRRAIQNPFVYMPQRRAIVQSIKNHLFYQLFLAIRETKTEAEKI